MNQTYPFSLEPLPYPYDALEPYIDTETMYFHHDKHLKTYVDNLNKALEPNPQLHNWPLSRLVSEFQLLPQNLQDPIRYNAGGVYNHQLYFNSMSKTPGSIKADSIFMNAIDLNFGSQEIMINTMIETASSVFGSGYAWLVAYDNAHLAIVSSANQDNPLSKGLFPLLPLDVWEHAYYLKHQNLRMEYLKAWVNVIDWELVEQRFDTIRYGTMPTR